MRPVTEDDEYFIGIRTNNLFVGGYSLQSSFIHDIRDRPDPFVRVYVYHGSQVSNAWIEAAVEYTDEDAFRLDEIKLAEMKSRRESYDAMIAEMEQQIAARKKAYETV